MLHRCCYPSCVGQAASWVISPLGYNTLLGYLEHSHSQDKKYVEVSCIYMSRCDYNTACTILAKLIK